MNERRVVEGIVRYREDYKLWHVSGVKDAMSFGGFVMSGIAPLGVFDGKAVTVTVEPFKCTKTHHLWYAVTADPDGNWPKFPKDLEKFGDANRPNGWYKCGACGKFKVKAYLEIHSTKEMIEL